MKPIIQILLILAATLAYIGNELRENHDHKEFFKEMREFKQFSGKGPRFTSEDAIRLCENLDKDNEVDCEKIVAGSTTADNS